MSSSSFNRYRLGGWIVKKCYPFLYTADCREDIQQEIESSYLESNCPATFTRVLKRNLYSLAKALGFRMLNNKFESEITAFEQALTKPKFKQKTRKDNYSDYAEFIKTASLKQMQEKFGISKPTASRLKRDYVN